MHIIPTSVRAFTAGGQIDVFNLDDVPDDWLVAMPLDQLNELFRQCIYVGTAAQAQRVRHIMRPQLPEPSAPPRSVMQFWRYHSPDDAGCDEPCLDD